MVSRVCVRLGAGLLALFIGVAERYSPDARAVIGKFFGVIERAATLPKSGKHSGNARPGVTC
jgi:hypothetical protein